MIAAILILQVAAASASADIDAYRACVAQNALKYERAKESAGDTVDAAIAACEDMRVKFRAEDLKSRGSDSALTPSDFRDVTMRIWDKVTEIERRKALLTVFQTRLSRAPTK